MGTIKQQGFIQFHDLGLRTGTPVITACYGLARAATLIAAALVLSID